MNDAVKNVLDSIGDTVKENPKTMAALVAGAGVGGIGGGLASSGKGDPSESKGERRKRILRNALLGGAAGAGAAGLGAYGYNQLNTALPKDDTDPATHIVTSPFGRGAMGAGLGALGWQAGKGKRESSAAGFLKSVGLEGEVQKGNARETLRHMMNATNAGPNAAGRFSAETLNQLQSNPTRTGKALIAAGLDPSKYQGLPDYRFTNHLPSALAKKYDKATGFVADKFRQIPGADKIPMGGVQNARKTVSRAAFRHPAVASLVAAGVLAPEVLSAAGALTGPVIPNLTHR